MLSPDARGVVEGLRANLRKIEDNLFKQLLARERMRWRYQHGGGFERDLDAFRFHHSQILRLQRQRFAIVKQMYEAIVADKPEKLAAAKTNWGKFSEVANQNFGLNNAKYLNIIETDAPLDPKERAKWLADPRYRSR